MGWSSFDNWVSAVSYVRKRLCVRPRSLRFEVGARRVTQSPHNCEDSCKLLTHRSKRRILGKLRTGNLPRNAPHWPCLWLRLGCAVYFVVPTAVFRFKRRSTSSASFTSKLSVACTIQAARPQANLTPTCAKRELNMYVACE